MCIGVLTVLVENVSSTETLPTRGPAPEINPTENNALLDSAEKVKTKVESEISPPKVEYLRKTPRAQNSVEKSTGKEKSPLNFASPAYLPPGKVLGYADFTPKVTKQPIWQHLM